MKYMLLTYLDEKTWHRLTEIEQQREMGKCAPHVDALIASGKFLDGAPLEPSWVATTVRYRDGKRVVTDGPHTETHEQQLGGYTLVEAADLDEAMAIASGFLEASDIATIEIRPVVSFRQHQPTGARAGAD